VQTLVQEQNSSTLTLPEMLEPNKLNRLIGSVKNSS